jgi:hypothetical protein
MNHLPIYLQTGYLEKRGPNMDREQVIARMDNWQQRLENFVQMLRSWYERLPENAYKDFLQGSIIQVDEDILKTFDVPPRLLPNCAVLFGRHRVSFVPGPLWILGANGRIYASTSRRQFALVDLGGDERSSDWQIITSTLQGTYRPFDEEIFRNLVLHEELAAA